MTEHETYHEECDDDHGQYHRRNHVNQVPLRFVIFLLLLRSLLNTGRRLVVDRGFLRREYRLDELFYLWGG
jgi:hypothetical protein